MNPKFHKYFMEVAYVTAELSNARRLKVGCVAVLDRRIICCGYNGTAPGEDNNCETEMADGTLVTKSNVFHAEINLIMFSKKHNISLEGCSLYLTHEPCEPCGIELARTGIIEVIADNAYTGSNPNSRGKLGSILNLKVGNYLQFTEGGL